MSLTRAALSTLVAVAGLAASAGAQVVTLADRNTESTFFVTGGAQIGWNVDGIGQLFNQRFFYRAGAMNDEVAVDNVQLATWSATDTNTAIDNRLDTLSATYVDVANSLVFDIKYSLQGSFFGGSADLAEQILISNFGNAAVSLSFFQYVDFDLSGTIENDFGEIENGRVAVSGASVTETVVTPRPSRFEANIFPNTVDKFGDGLPTNLSNFAGPVVGDATWAFQWDRTLLPGQSLQISKDKLIVIPTPGAAALGLIGAIAAGRRRRV